MFFINSSNTDTQTLKYFSLCFRQSLLKAISTKNKQIHTIVVTMILKLLDKITMAKVCVSSLRIKNNFGPNNYNVINSTYAYNFKKKLS